MTAYLFKFFIYIFSMLGVMFVAFLIYKHTTNFTGKKNSQMQIVDQLNLSPRKTLFVIKVQNEKFLIASDTDKTTFLAKLKENESIDLNKVNDEILDKEDKKDKTNLIKKANKMLNDLKINKNENKKDEEKPENNNKNTFDEAISDVKEEDLEKIKEKPVNVLKELTRKRSA